MINIAIIGYGRMGKWIKKIAGNRGIIVKSVIDPVDKEANFKEINDESLKDVDVCVDFTEPDVAVGNVKKISKLGKNIVMATTGWYDNINEVKKIVEKHNIGFIYSPNFSIGVNVFFRIIKNAAKTIDKIPDYDAFVYELHHNRKQDSPSGTAKKIGDILVGNIDRKKKLVFDKLDRKIKKDELHVASVRTGEIPGTHVVGFDSKADTIELKHTARSREGFAVGAIMAAEWINGKKGFYNINDMLDEIIGGE